MSHPLPTIRVKHPDDPNVCMIINASDRTQDHVPWDDAGEETSELRVAKGPRGKWYVKLGKENVEGPFDTEDEAKAAMGDK